MQTLTEIKNGLSGKEKHKVEPCHNHPDRVAVIRIRNVDLCQKCKRAFPKRNCISFSDAISSIKHVGFMSHPLPMSKGRL
jgi:hypothetical protein